MFQSHSSRFFFFFLGGRGTGPQFLSSSLSVSLSVRLSLSLFTEDACSSSSLTSSVLIFCVHSQREKVLNFTEIRELKSRYYYYYYYKIFFSVVLVWINVTFVKKFVLILCGVIWIGDFDVGSLLLWRSFYFGIWGWTICWVRVINWWKVRFSSSHKCTC